MSDSKQEEIIRDLRESAFKMLRTASVMEAQLGDELVTDFGRAKTRAGSHVLLAEAIYSERRRRDKYLASDLLGEPAWDIVLDLYIRTKRGEPTPVTSACVAAATPPTTALRYLRELEERGIVYSEPGRLDRRHRIVWLTRRTVRQLDRYFGSSRLPEQLLAQADPEEINHARAARG